MPLRCENDPGKGVDQLINVRPTHQFGLLLHQAQLQHLGLCLDMIGVRLTARRLLPLAPQVSQVANAALVERKAITLPLDHAFGCGCNRSAAPTPTR
jgi:hypothetical protein